MIDLKEANHTGRELELMLSSRKPLAMFYDEVGFLPNEEIIPEEAFRPYVERGSFVRSEMTLEQEFSQRLGRNVQIRYVLFALSSEAWRIPAMVSFLKVRDRSGIPGSEGFERVECALLGYSAEETDAWCHHVFANGGGRTRCGKRCEIA